MPVPISSCLPAPAFPDSMMRDWHTHTHTCHVGSLWGLRAILDDIVVKIQSRRNKRPSVSPVSELRTKDPGEELGRR